MIAFYEIRRFCERHKMPLTTFGKEAANNPGLAGRIMNGAELRPVSELAIRDYMARKDAELAK